MTELATNIILDEADNPIIDETGESYLLDETTPIVVITRKKLGASAGGRRWIALE